ncbi:hypothetical protein P3W85_37335 [Cupriavidus basilensis]|uniref:ABC-three component systems C-terminal domain-containing protein n=1 Tax=Cupriavidus basilensis TaxID=68895 RepID=A0ABT6B1S1_9BURK|nr:ABC-three component system protein [Cupriavidus basilensis]MDF3838558.1 hypothetical protein [Cupriavidus basilensis]
MNARLPGPVKHSAPGQYLGFALQPVRMCFHLLSSQDGASVSLEHLDDVAVHFLDGSVIVEQAKSALAHNPLSDWSEDLWKTIANWLQEVRCGTLDMQKTQFRMYVTPTKKGKWSDLLHTSSSDEQVKALTKDIRKKLAAKATAPKCLEYLQVFLDATDAERHELVRRLAIISTDDDPVQALNALLTPTIAPHLIEVITHAAIGMAKEWADRCIRRGRPAIVDANEFRTAFHAFVQKNNMPGYLASLTASPEASTVQKLLSGKPVFVRQLQLIEATDEQRLRAVSDFLRASADKAFWAEHGQVFEASFTEWEDSLKRRHSAIESEVGDLHSDKSEQVRGRLIYNRCSVLEPTLDGREVPGHFAHGSFNALADDQILGWHPRYAELLEQGNG